MSYKEWNKGLIDKQIALLSKEYAISSDLDLYAQIEMLKTLKNMAPPLFPKNKIFSQHMESELEALTLYYDFIDDITQFSKLKSFSNKTKYKINTLNKYNLKDSAILSFTHDFYNKLDTEIAKAFNKIYRERKNNIQFSNSRSYSVFIASLKYAYLNIERNESIEDYESTIHEYAHAIADLLCPRTSYNSYPFIELLPLTMSLIALDELNRIYLNFDQDILILKASSIQTILQHAKNIVLEVNFLDNIGYYEDKNSTINHFAKYAKLDKNSASIILEVSLNERLAYVVPFLVAIELYYIYYNDKDLFMYILKSIIKMKNVENYNLYLNDLGIFLNTHSKTYVDDIKRKLNKIR